MGDMTKWHSRGELVGRWFEFSARR